MNNVAYGRLDERHQRLIVRLVFTIYLLLIFEGALRKWIAPQFGKPLFFIRDPFVLAIYILVLSKRTRFRRGFLEIGCLFAAIGLILIAGQRILGTRKEDLLPPLLAAYGWRNYFFYLPLAFIIGRYLNLQDLGRLIRITALIAVLMSGVVIVQFASAPNAGINAGSSDDPNEAYYNLRLPEGHVRAAGTFTSNLGLTAFAASEVAFALSLWLTRPRSPSLNFYLRLGCVTAGAVICLSFSGSRGALVWSGLILVMAIAGLSLASGSLGLRALLLVSVLVISGAAIAPILFPDAIRVFAHRWSDGQILEEQAYGSGGIYGRMLYELFDFNLLLGDTPPQGYGLGSSGNAAWQLGTRSDVVTFYTPEQVGAAESDWGRHILELGPFFGCLFILYRVGLTIWLGKEALGATRRSGNPLPWLLFAFVGIIMFNQQITGNGTENAYGWLFTGFCLAASNSVSSSRRSIGQRAGGA
ncbi:MAG: hypothetical protein JO307_07370, partial [Bryobacterales bacterium]|nr:hypothetical protein [Bryobacterales bacterium]